MDEAEQARLAAEAEAARVAAAAAADADKNKPDPNADELVRLRAELASRDATLAQFEGLDPAAAKQALADKQEAERKTAEAERAKAEADGNWERVRELMVQERDGREQALKDELALAKQGQTTVEQRLDSLTIGTAFGESEFIKKKCALPVAKIRQLYQDHVEVVDGATVVYDAPKGAAKRTMIIDSNGKPAAFNVAIEKVITADPDKDTMLVSDIKPGAGSRDSGGRKDIDPQKSRHERMAAGLAQLKR